MCTAEDLVVLKAIAARPKDIEDAEALLALYPDIDLERVRSRVAELSALAEAPELLVALDGLAARASGSAAGNPAARPPNKGRRRRRG